MLQPVVAQPHYSICPGIQTTEQYSLIFGKVINMVVAKRVIVIGDGPSGIVAANKLRFHATEKELEILVVGNTTRHFYKPDGLFIPFGYKNYRKSVKPVEFLLNGGVQYIHDEVVRINSAEHLVFLKSGKSLMADYIVIATGNRYAPEEIPGYSGEAKHFYDLQKALELRETLKGFQGGNVVIGSTGATIQYPQALYEFAFLLDSYLTTKELREKTEITYLSPSENLGSDATLSNFIKDKLQEKNIELHTNLTVSTVNQKNKEVVAADDAKFKYNLLVLVPPHRGQQAMTQSGLAGENGYIEVNAKTLTVKDNDAVYAVGDSNNLFEHKLASSGYLEASFAASRIIADAIGGLSDDQYVSVAPQINITGKDKAFTYLSSPEAKVKAITENKGDFMLRWTSNDTYFSTILRGMV